MSEPVDPVELYRLVFEKAPVGIFHFDARGIVTAVNPKMAEMLGAPPGGSVGIDMLRLHGEGRDRIAALVAETLQGRPARYEGPYTSLGTGKTFEASAVLSPIRGPDGSIQGGVAIVTDAKAERLASIGALAAGVAHEINNPLVYVMLGLETIERDLARMEARATPEDWERLRAMCREALAGAERMRAIVRELSGEIRRGAVEQAGTSRAPISQPAPRRARVLVIDDEPNLGVTLAAGLRDRADFVSVRTGRAAVDRLLADDAFDLILCDLMMPDLTGIDVFEQIERARPALAGRFVFTSGGAVTERARAFIGRVRRLDKPFRLEDVEALLVNAVHQASPNK
jgi:PAS domain S-box-containing protein